MRRRFETKKILESDELIEGLEFETHNKVKIIIDKRFRGRKGILKKLWSTLKYIYNNSDLFRAYFEKITIYQKHVWLILNQTGMEKYDADHAEKILDDLIHWSKGLSKSPIENSHHDTDLGSPQSSQNINPVSLESTHLPSLEDDPDLPVEPQMNIDQEVCALVSLEKGSFDASVELEEAKHHIQQLQIQLQCAEFAMFNLFKQRLALTEKALEEEQIKVADLCHRLLELQRIESDLEKEKSLTVSLKIQNQTYFQELFKNMDWLKSLQDQHQNLILQTKKNENITNETIKRMKNDLDLAKKRSQYSENENERLRAELELTIQGHRTREIEKESSTNEIIKNLENELEMVKKKTESKESEIERLRSELELTKQGHTVEEELYGSKIEVLEKGTINTSTSEEQNDLFRLLSSLIASNFEGRECPGEDEDSFISNSPPVYLSSLQKSQEQESSSAQNIITTARSGGFNL